MDKEAILSFIKAQDWNALARAWHEADIHWHADEWADFVEAIQHLSTKRGQQIFEALHRDVIDSLPETTHPITIENIQEVFEKYRKTCYPLAKL